MPARHRNASGSPPAPSPAPSSPPSRAAARPPLRQESPQPRRSPGGRTPLLLRGTLVFALLAAAAASVLRAHVDVAGMAGSALRLRLTHVDTAARQLAGPPCTVDLAVTRHPNGWSSVQVGVRNRTPATIDGWVLRWTPPAGQAVRPGRGAGLARAGVDVVATDAGFDRRIPAAGRVAFSFEARPAMPARTRFTLNGVTCR